MRSRGAAGAASAVAAGQCSFYGCAKRGGGAVALVSYAQAAQQALALEMQQHDDVVLMGEDIGRGGVFGQYAGLQANYGVQRVMDTPI
ncbi:MAG: hypothetical protein VW518_06760, partial [Burkholderiaceae bacterium]